MSKQTPRLGRGLSVLIAPREHRPAGVEAADGLPGEKVQQIPIDAIRPNPRQPRQIFTQEAIEELAQSIRVNGVIQPIILRSATDGGYELVAGERRLRAARLADLTTIPAIVRRISDSESLELALVENLQREDLNPLERAAAYRNYLDTFNVGPEQLARRLGESRPNVANYLRLLQLPTEIQDLVRSGQLGMGHARAIISIEDPQRQLAIARLTIRRNLAVRQVEALARPTSTEPIHAKASPGALPDRHIGELEQTLSRTLGLPVKLVPGRKKNSGRVVIYYRNLDEFDLLAARIGARRSMD